MSDLSTLHDAFGELERRADAAPHTTPAPPHRTRWGLVAASAVAVLAVAGGALVLAGSGNDGTPAAGPASPSASASAPASAVPTTAPPATSASRQPARQLPSTGQEMVARLQEILGTTGKITSFQGYGGNYVVGRIATDEGAGSFDIQTVDRAGGAPMCEDPDRMVCTTHRLPDGSKYAFGREESQLQSGGILYLVNLVRTDGTSFLFHVSNEGDPKGGDGLLGDAPPLTRKQMLAIVRSDLWGR